MYVEVSGCRWGSTRMMSPSANSGIMESPSLEDRKRSAYPFAEYQTAPTFQHRPAENYRRSETTPRPGLMRSEGSPSGSSPSMAADVDLLPVEDPFPIIVQINKKDTARQNPAA